mgnify:CR=1 FL=1
MPLTTKEAQQLEDFLALIAMQSTGVYDDLRLVGIRERFEAREAQRRVP